MATAPDQPSAQLPGEVDKKSWLESHEAGYHKTLGNRQVQMIAIGGAIGTGLFLGAGARLQIAGPALALVYLVCGVFFPDPACTRRIGHAPSEQRQLCVVCA